MVLLAEALHDVPKWEHAESGALRIRVPKLDVRESGMVAAQGPEDPA